ncbi:DMT family transporter [Rhodovulum sp. DZ06]|uniref:DMT family transporter n=1 Tax=Rhodovulum sp. DZ06 TaxID=3425126 RepID=UPI003D3279FB
MHRLSPNALGALFMSLSMLGFASNDVVMKTVSGGMELFQMVFLRGIAAVLLIFALAAWQRALRPRITRRTALILALRIIGETAGAYLFLRALFAMPIANATAILQVMPLAVTLGAAAVFGERLGARRLGAIAAGFAGMLIIVRPGTEGFDMNALWAVGAVVFLVVRDLSTRALPPELPSAFVTLCTALGMLALGAVGTAAQGWTPPPAGAPLFLVLAAVLVLGGYYFGVLSMRAGDVAAAAPFRYTILLWAMLFGALVFGELPDAPSLFGAAVVVAAGVYTFRRERALARAGHVAAAELGGAAATAADGRGGATPPPPPPIHDETPPRPRG